MQRADASALGLQAVERPRLRQSMVGVEMNESTHFAIDRGDPIQAGGGVFLGAHQAARDIVRGFRRGEFGQIDSGHCLNSS